MRRTKVNGLTWEQRFRFAFIEAQLKLYGYVTRQDLYDFFGLSRSGVTDTFRAYKKAMPGNMHYDEEQHCNVAGKRLKTPFLSEMRKDLRHWLDMR